MSDDEDNSNSKDEKKVCPLFVQLNEYASFKQENRKWLERCRWIKFEEKVEEAGDHWSKPHVAILTFTSISLVKESLKNAIFSFEHEGDNVEDILDNILKLATDNLKLTITQRNELFVILCKKHKGPGGNALKTNQRGSSLSISKLTSTEKNTENKKSSDPENPVNEEESFYHYDSRLKKKTRIGSEVANILVGEFSFLNTNLIFLIRLKNPLCIGRYSEVKLPTRFIVILLGPHNNSSTTLFEQARVFGCLFSDSIFREIAYTAKRIEDIERGIDLFVEGMMIVPPSQWDPDIRINPPKNIIPERQLTGLVNGNEDTLDEDSEEKKVEEEEDDEDDGLVKTGRFCGGLVDDIKRKAKWYLSDFRDALDIQCLSSFFFLYFACLTPIITFGGLLMKATDGYLGAIESIVAGTIVGVVYALFSGQPLTILGSTGPILVFESIIFRFCTYMSWDFLSFRLWIGLWVALIMLFFVMFDLSYLVKYITKFTEECFAMLIALIYIVESFQKLFYMLNDFPVNKGWTPDYVLNRTCECIPKNTDKVVQMDHGDHIKRMLKFETPPLRDGWKSANVSCIHDFIEWKNISAGYFTWKSHDYKEICVDYGGEWVGNTCGKLYVPDVFVFSWILMLGTFGLATFLRVFRSSRLFPNILRNILGNFAVVIAIVTFTVIDLISGLHTPKLKVPTKFQPTLGYDTRSWIVHPLGKNPWWSIIVAILPSLIAGILIFMDQQITAVIVNRKSHKLKKGYGYHLDLFVVALLIAINSIIGVPWFVAATVLSLNHVMSLKKESTNNAPGEAPQFLGCREQRVTHFFIFTFVGLSIFMTPVLQRIPMPVLYGVFLYMGIGPLGEMEFIQRILLVFMSPKNRPDYKYLRLLPIMRVHFFTFIQLLCLVLLWVIKSVKAIAIAFPLMVLAMCFIRKAMECCFSYQELALLDHPLPGVSPDNKTQRNCCPCVPKSPGSEPEDQHLLEPVSPNSKDIPEITFTPETKSNEKC